MCCMHLSHTATEWLSSLRYAGDMVRNSRLPIQSGLPRGSSESDLRGFAGPAGRMYLQGISLSLELNSISQTHSCVKNGCGDSRHWWSMTRGILKKMCHGSWTLHDMPSQSEHYWQGTSRPLVTFMECWAYQIVRYWRRRALSTLITNSAYCLPRREALSILGEENKDEKGTF